MMVKPYFSVLFSLLCLSACNSQHADLGRISSRPPFIVQFGELQEDSCRDMVIDRFENIYCAGHTASSLGGTQMGLKDAFVAKFNRQGNLIWIKQFGGDGDDQARAIGVDHHGNVYCGGTTNDFVISDPDDRIDTDLPRNSTDIDTDVFVTKLSPGGTILWTRQFGSAGEEGCNNMVVSSAGDTYCAANTTSVMGTLPGTSIKEWQGATPSQDAMMAKLNKDGDIIWIRQLGQGSIGSRSDYNDYCLSVILDEDENAYCAGGTFSDIAETNGAGNGSQDSFIWKVDKNGYTKKIRHVGIATNDAADDLTPPEMININAAEECMDILVDTTGNIYCSGITNSNYGENAAGGWDAFIIKFDKDFNFQWLTHFGQTTKINDNNVGNQQFESLILGPNGSVIALGSTSSSTVKTSYGGQDFFAVAFDPSGNILWSNQYGSSGNDFCYSGTTDSSGNIYCAGNSSGSFGKANAGASDALIMRLDPQGNNRNLP